MISAFALLLAGQQADWRADHVPNGMEYYVSLPDGWTARKRWPVVLVIESAERDFVKNMRAFIAARGKRPYILLEPLVVTGGGARVRGIPSYHYSDDLWQRIEKDPWAFDRDGMLLALRSVQKNYEGERECYLTAWEAGGHTAFALLLSTPGIAKGAVIVCPNYQDRWVSGRHLTSVQREGRQWKVCGGSLDPAWQKGQPIFEQALAGYEALKKLYPQAMFTDLPGEGHGPCCRSVIDYFDQFRLGSDGAGGRQNSSQWTYAFPAR